LGDPTDGAWDVTGAAGTDFYALHLILTDPQPTAAAPTGDPSPDTATFDALAAAGPLTRSSSPLAVPAGRPGKAPRRIDVVAALAGEDEAIAARPDGPHQGDAAPTRAAEIDSDFLESHRREQ
jgi:hypothetical protein